MKWVSTNVKPKLPQRCAHRRQNTPSATGDPKEASSGPTAEGRPLEASGDLSGDRA